MNIIKTRVIFDRKKVATKTKKSSVIIEVYYDRQRKFFTTGVELYKDQWKKDMVVGRADAVDLMERINHLKARIDEYINERLKAKEEINLDMLRKWIDGHSEGKCASFLAFMQSRINERPMADGTRDAHQSVYNTLSKWGKIVLFADLTPSNIILWDELSKTNSKSGKTIPNYHKVLRCYVKEAISFGHIKENPYKDFKQKYDRRIKHAFLTKQELKRWEEIQLDDKIAEKARDMFVFCTYTGLAYADLKDFEPKFIYEENGSFRYRNDRHKTDEDFAITILKPAMNVIKKYGCVPMMDEHVYNRYLKVVACLCHIPKKISTHCARVSFATTVMLGNKVHLKILQKAMGHTNILQTSEYAKLTTDFVDEEFDRLNKIL